MSYLGPAPRQTGAPAIFTVERSSIDPPEWSVFSVTPHGGIGARCYGPTPDKREAEAWAVAAGALADPIDEAA